MVGVGCFLDRALGKICEYNQNQTRSLVHTFGSLKFLFTSSVGSGNSRSARALIATVILR